ncbi:MAG: hypothetical protein Harvfovirus50_8 [Harvfovirus sp.]|uniref:Tetratricopeptide repeat protein n=1 Tax=Harvfovirus sp. TaxID=2487768 RepID=A0A3G5A370_9VIRU|nr:MAG: hypothetical protein Harvfovirus50_8 [Harvfovirus sp.]
MPNDNSIIYQPMTTDFSESRTPYIELPDSGTHKQDLINANKQRYRRLADHYLDQQDISRAIKYYQRGASLSDPDSYLSLARIYNNKANSSMTKHSERKCAIDYYEKYLTNNNSPVVISYKELGDLYYESFLSNITFPSEREQLIMNAIVNYEKYNESEKDARSDIEFVKNLGKCYEAVDEQKALQFYKDLYESGMAHHVLENICDLLGKSPMNRTDDCLKWHILGVKQEMPDSKYKIACIYQAHGSLAKAREFCLLAEREYAFTNDKSPDIVKCHTFLANLLLEEM